MKRGIFLLMILLLLAACKENDGKPNDWRPGEVIKINGQPIKAEEIAVYGIQVKKEFEQIGGPDIWEFESFSGGRSAYEVAKTKVLENLIRVKILAAKAGERKIELTEEEKEGTDARAESFYNNKEELKAAGAEITPEITKQVFAEFELGQKLKSQMLKSFRPGAEMVEAKLAEDEAYQSLLREDPWEKRERYLVQSVKIESNEANKEKLEEIQRQLDENQGLTDELSESMVYQEEEYTKADLDKQFGEGFTDNLRKNPEQLILLEEEAAYLFVKLSSVELPDSNGLSRELRKLEVQKRKLQEQAEESVRDESFDVIYKEWKKEADIQINQEIWQGLVVFTLPTENK